MTEHLRRWLWAPESTVDSAAGAVIYGTLIVVVFRFGFGDGWPFAIGSGVVLGLASFAFGEWSRRRRPSADEPGDPPG